MQMDLKAHIRDIHDFPKKGIVFKDITTLLLHPEAFKTASQELLKVAQKVEVDKVVGMEARGFIFGPTLAQQLGVGFIPIRKPGKLPAPTYSQSYTLEYGTDIIEMHQDAIQPGDKILIHDDLLATGGTAKAAAQLVEKAGGEIVQFSFLIELAFLNGRNILDDYSIESILTY